LITESVYNPRGELTRRDPLRGIAEFVLKRTLSSIDERGAGISQRTKPILERRYWRSLQDLPIQGTPVILRVHVSRWRCRNAGCERRIFTERPLNVCAPHARQTKRSDEIIAVVGRALGGRPGQRLMGRLGMPLSADTLIRRVKGAARWSALPQVIRVLGVDDWAWCKGQNFRHHTG
jgi:hypothetical protein